MITFLNSVYKLFNSLNIYSGVLQQTSQLLHTSRYKTSGHVIFWMELATWIHFMDSVPVVIRRAGRSVRKLRDKCSCVICVTAHKNEIRSFCSCVAEDSVLQGFEAATYNRRKAGQNVWCDSNCR